ncbi:MAG: hypothetical protein ABSB38_00205 [Dehalococcoidia bacterium]
MPKRSSKKQTPKDTNELAASIVEQVTSEPEAPPKEKNPNAVALGRLGGLKGGKARAEKLTPEQRTEIAKMAASTRWKIAPH